MFFMMLPRWLLEFELWLVFSSGDVVDMLEALSVRRMWVTPLDALTGHLLLCVGQLQLLHGPWRQAWMLVCLLSPYNLFPIVEMHEMVPQEWFERSWHCQLLWNGIGCRIISISFWWSYGWSVTIMDATLGLIKAAPPCYSWPFYSCTAGDYFTCVIFTYTRDVMLEMRTIITLIQCCEEWLWLL